MATRNFEQPIVNNNIEQAKAKLDAQIREHFPSTTKILHQTDPVIFRGQTLMSLVIYEESSDT